MCGTRNCDTTVSLVHRSFALTSTCQLKCSSPKTGTALFWNPNLLLSSILSRHFLPAYGIPPLFGRLARLFGLDTSGFGAGVLIDGADGVQCLEVRRSVSACRVEEARLGLGVWGLGGWGVGG
jgi:hypothetical protein